MTTHDNARFAKALRKAMEDANITQAALARELKTDASQVNRWANGNAVPHINTVRRIEKFLKADRKQSPPPVRRPVSLTVRDCD
jgi:ribosome-binding protein aMBF1 (putative translation factor)